MISLAYFVTSRLTFTFSVEKKGIIDRRDYTFWIANCSHERVKSGLTGAMYSTSTCVGPSHLSPAFCLSFAISVS